jgi:hypothetical protein
MSKPGAMRAVTAAFRAVMATACVAFFVTAWAASPAADGKFTIAVVPDTQNYIDFNHQRATGFAFDSAEIFYDQMQWLARNVESAGGEIAFITQVGDVWQNYSEGMDPAHRALGMQVGEGTLRAETDPRTRSVELPAARRGFEMIDGKVPFSVVPGNHDYDAVWLVKGVTPQQMHIGGLTNFNSVFGERSAFFRNKPWRVSSFNGGADSATLFSAGGYRFLHIGLEYEPGDDVLAWAESVMRRYPGLPTLFTTHNFLNSKGERKSTADLELKLGHPQHNNPEDMWQKLLSRHAQIFLVVSGHQTAQSWRVDAGAEGGKVWQMLSDFQNRSQVYRNVLGLAPDARAPGIGDGWLRLLEFDFTAAVPRMRVRTYSTYFKAYASELPNYVAWYKKEKPALSDAAFLAEDEFAVDLDDFVKRFGPPKSR